MNPVLLCYNLSPETMKKLRPAALRWKIRMQAVRPEETELPLYRVLAHEVPEEKAVSAFEEEMLVMAGFPEFLVNSFLDTLRRAKAPAMLKAVLTPYNMEWTSNQLYGELCKERSAFAEGKQPVHEPPEEQETTASE